MGTMAKIFELVTTGSPMPVNEASYYNSTIIMDVTSKGNSSSTGESSSPNMLDLLIIFMPVFIIIVIAIGSLLVRTRILFVSECVKVLCSPNVDDACFLHRVCIVCKKDKDWIT